MKHGGEPDIAALIPGNAEIIDIHAMLFRVIDNCLLQRGIGEPPCNHLTRQLLILVIGVKDQFRFAPRLKVLAGGQGVRTSVWSPHLDCSDEAVVGGVKAEIRFIAGEDWGRVMSPPHDSVRGHRAKTIA